MKSLGHVFSLIRSTEKRNNTVILFKFYSDSLSTDLTNYYPCKIKVGIPGRIVGIPDGMGGIPGGIGGIPYMLVGIPGREVGIPGGIGGMSGIPYMLVGIPGGIGGIKCTW